MIIELKVKHFKDNKYNSTLSCPLAKAIKEGIQPKYPYVFKSYVLMNYKKYDIVNGYTYNHYLWDKFKSRFYWNKEKVLRTVTLIEVK